MANTINLSINGIAVCVEKGKTILEAAQKLHIKIPTLCYHKDLCVAGNCRVCVVEQTGVERLVASCATPVSEGMEINTNSLKVRNSRKHIIELLLTEHKEECTKCYRNGHCELQSISADLQITNQDFIDLVPDKFYSVDSFSPSIEKDDSKCIRCQRCVRTCAEIQNVGAIAVAHKGCEMKISTFFNYPLHEVVCTNCGQCIVHCPTGALVEKSYVEPVWDAIAHPKKHVVVQTAPSVRIALGEELGLEAGTRVTKRMVSALKRLGFDSVLDTDFTADLTIMEEGTELLTRLKGALLDENPDISLPMATSCCPGWVKYIEHKYPQYLPNLSTCKSPQQMFGALAKTYYAKNIDVDPEHIVSVSIMPCTAKKYEANRPEMKDSGYKDVDYVLTTRELAVMIKQAGIEFSQLNEEEFDSIMGIGSGAGAIFGASGGVMEAALRTAYEIVTGREVPFDNLEIKPIRGLSGVKEAIVPFVGVLPEWSFLEGVELKCAIANGLENTHQLMEAIARGEKSYHFIEIMACSGGCLAGGGQPFPVNDEIRQKRMDAIYSEDLSLAIRKSHKNPEIIRIYKDFLGVPLSPKSHELLHTSYVKRKPY